MESPLLLTTIPRVQGDGITTLLDSEEETGTGMVKAVLKVCCVPMCFENRPLEFCKHAM